MRKLREQRPECACRRVPEGCAPVTIRVGSVPGASWLLLPLPPSVSSVSSCKLSNSSGLESLFAPAAFNKASRIHADFPRLDRLGRSLPHLAQLVSELAAHGVTLVCTSQGIDTSNDNPAGRLQLGVLMAVAEFEREIIRELVNAGLRAAKARGVRLGRPTTNGVHSEDVQQLLAEGKGIRAIARDLGLPVASVHKLAQQG